MAASLFLIMVVLNLISHSEAAELSFCRETPVNNSTNYATNYNKLVASIGLEIAKDGDGRGELGDPPNRLYLFWQCIRFRDIHDHNGCVACFNKITKDLTRCFPATGGRILYKDCYIRAENYSFFDYAVEPTDYVKCGDTFNPNPAFSEEGKQWFESMVLAGTDKNLWFFALWYQEKTGIFVISSCWNTINSDLCGVCLEDAMRRVAACLPATEGSVLNSGCAVLYADYDLGYNTVYETRNEAILPYGKIVCGGLAVISLIVAIAIYVRRATYPRKTQHRNTNEKENFLEFNYSTLEEATDCFDDSHKLGKGDYGEVFKGILADGKEIAIKRLFATGTNQNDEIRYEIDTISRAQHKNLVGLLGCCFTNTDNLLVYEFLVNRSLDQILFGRPRDEETIRLENKKADNLRTAEGLEYLHNGCQLRIVHRDIKASNILLDSKWKPKIADFGLARFSSCGSHISSAIIAGTFYLAPEYIAQGRLTEKVDVYSFGVLMFELVSGVRNKNLWSDSSSQTLVSHMWKRFQSDTIMEIVDKDMDIDEDMVDKEIKRVVQVGLLCTQQSPELRPSMKMVIEILEQDYEIVWPTPTRAPFLDEHLEFSSFGSFGWQPDLHL